MAEKLPENVFDQVFEDALLKYQNSWSLTQHQDHKIASFLQYTPYSDEYDDAFVYVEQEAAARLERTHRLVQMLQLHPETGGPQSEDLQLLTTQIASLAILKIMRATLQERKGVVVGPLLVGAVEYSIKEIYTCLGLKLDNIPFGIAFNPPCDEDQTNHNFESFVGYRYARLMFDLGDRGIDAPLIYTPCPSSCG